MKPGKCTCLLLQRQEARSGYGGFRPPRKWVGPPGGRSSHLMMIDRLGRAMGGGRRGKADSVRKLGVVITYYYHCVYIAAWELCCGRNKGRPGPWLAPALRTWPGPDARHSLSLQISDGRSETSCLFLGLGSYFWPGND